MTDERLQALYAEVVARRAEAAGRGRPACPAPDAILALVERAGAEVGRLATLDHVMACAACLAEFELLRAVVVAGRPPAGRRLTWPVLALAATVLIAVGLGGLWRARQDRAPGPPVMRGGAEGAVSTVLPDPDRPAARPVVFVWHAVPGATRYALEMIDPDGRPAFMAGTADTSVTLPPTVTLDAGAEYRWIVRAALAGGGERRSAARAFRVASP
jgi:hypothetical protein